MKKLLLGAVIALSANGYAEDAHAATLKEVMQQLGQSYTTLNHAILIGDFDQAMVSAKAISDHEKLSMGQRMKIMATLGTDMVDFKNTDQKVHQLALDIEQAAIAKDMPLLIKRQSQMLSACMACHTTYRSRVMEAMK